LHPFDISFYRKFGWEILSEYKKLTIEKANFKFLDSQPGNIKRFSKEIHNAEIENVYIEYCKAFRGMLVRNTEWWIKSVYNNDSQIAVYYNHLNDAKGYILYNVKERKMEIKELIALDHEARVGLWNFICQHDSMIESVSIKLPIHDSFPFFLQQPKVKMEVEPYFMARLVDVEACLKKFPFLKGMDEAIFIHVEDAFAPWNNGSYLVGKGEIKVFKEKEGSRCVQPPKRGIQLTVNALSAILFGYKRPLELYELGYLKGSEAEVVKLDTMIPNSKPSFYEFF
jgi:predicted acetyltransferase